VTRTPIVVLAYTADGNIKSYGSSKGMKEFAQDPAIIQKFKDSLPNNAAFEEESSESESESEDEEETPAKKQKLTFDVDWEDNLKVIPKRDLLCDITYRSTGFTKRTMKWVEQNKPSWWPRRILFRSPHGKSKIPVAEMDDILRSFHEHKVIKAVEKLCSDDVDVFFPTFSKMEEHLNLFLKKASIITEWLKRNRKIQRVAMADIEYRCRYLTTKFGTRKEPILFGSIHRCLSFHFFGTPHYENFFKILSLAYAVTRKNDLNNYICDGIDDVSPKKFQSWLNVKDINNLEASLLTNAFECNGNSYKIS